MNELAHYGILGMKWGVRRTPEQLARASARKQQKREKKVNRALKEKELSDKILKGLSDEELKRVVGRLQMEKQYRDLTEKKENLSQGKKVAFAALDAFGRSAAATLGKRMFTEKKKEESKPSELEKKLTDQARADNRGRTKRSGAKDDSGASRAPGTRTLRTLRAMDSKGQLKDNEELKRWVRNK